MTNTANTPKTNDYSIIGEEIGKATYVVRVHFSETVKKTMGGKVKRMLREEVRKM